MRAEVEGRDPEPSVVTGSRPVGANGRPGGLVSGDISRLVVQLFRSAIGRGPTRVRTYVTPPVITVVLRDTLTRLETTLVEHGRCDAVVATRRAVQRSLQPQLADGIGRLAGSTVLSVCFDHQIDRERDIVAITLVLDEPEL